MPRIAGPSAAKIAGARTFETFLYVVAPNATKSIQTERCSALAGFFATVRTRTAKIISLDIADTPAPICIGSRTLLRAIADFFYHIEKSGTQNAMSAGVRELKGSRSSICRRSRRHRASQVDEERDLYDSERQAIQNENRKPKGAKPWQFPERQDINRKPGMRSGRRAISSSPCRSSSPRKALRRSCLR